MWFGGSEFFYADLVGDERIKDNRPQSGGVSGVIKPTGMTA